MKIRIKGNSVRFRLTKSEVEKLAHTGYLEEHTSFRNTAFVYALKSKIDSDELSADFDGGKMSMFIPETFVKDWVVNNVVGLEARMLLTGNEHLYLLVEKDFVCIDNKMEEQGDHYDNPNKMC